MHHTPKFHFHTNPKIYFCNLLSKLYTPQTQFYHLSIHKAISFYLSILLPHTWGLIRVMFFLRWLVSKVHIPDLATWGGFSRSVCCSSWRWRMSMVWLKRCRCCRTRLFAYISILGRDHALHWQEPNYCGYCLAEVL